MNQRAAQHDTASRTQSGSEFRCERWRHEPKPKALEKQFLSAVVEIDRRLSIYPQFGEPIQDLPSLPGQIWVATVPPLVVQYAVDDQRRQVIVGVPLQSLPGSGF